jgi:hypothetical protein
MARKKKAASVERYEYAKKEVDRQFPAGRFVAVESGRIVADADSHRQLVEKLHAQGKTPKDLLIVQAGVDYPDSAVIFATAPVRPRHG